jgi:hypothetical protein
MALPALPGSNQRMPRQPEVPWPLRTGPFHRQAAYELGMTRHHLAARCWARLFRDVFVHQDVELTAQRRLDALRLAAPGGAALVGRSAAWLFGIWTPPPGTLVPMEIALPTGGRRFDQRGVQAHRLVFDEGDLDYWEGVAVTTPERTCFGLMTRSSPTGAVVWADRFLHHDLVTAAGLRRYADERPSWPHVRKVRDAVERARAGAASPMETRLRLIIVDGGLPEPPLLNQPIYDANGRFLGVPDLGYDPPPFGIEYDGAYHEDAQQRAADNRRENGLLIGDFPLLRYGRDDVYNSPGRIVAEVRAMLNKAG